MIDYKIKLSLWAGVFAASIWCIADMLLVGFIARPDAYPLFSNILSSQINAELALLMLDASPQRLMWGVYLATFSIFLYLLSIYAIYRSLPKNKLATVTVLALFIGYAISPLGHAGFVYIGLLAQSMLYTSPDQLTTQIVLFQQFEKLLNIHWLVSVTVSAIGWLLVFIHITLGKMPLPRWFSVFCPILTAPLLALICSLFPQQLIAVLVGCSSLNISQLLFFLLWVRLYEIKN